MSGAQTAAQDCAMSRYSCQPSKSTIAQIKGLRVYAEYGDQTITWPWRCVMRVNSYISQRENFARVYPGVESCAQPYARAAEIVASAAMGNAFSGCDICPEGDWETTWDAATLRGGSNARQLRERIRAQCTAEQECREELDLEQQRRVQQWIANWWGAAIGGSGSGSGTQGAAFGMTGAIVEEVMNEMFRQGLWDGLDRVCLQQLVEASFGQSGEVPIHLPPVYINVDEGRVETEGDSTVITIPVTRIYGRVPQSNSPTPEPVPPVRLWQSQRPSCHRPCVQIHQHASETGGDVNQSVTLRLLAETNAENEAQIFPNFFRIPVPVHFLPFLPEGHSGDVVLWRLDQSSDADILLSPSFLSEPEHIADGRQVFLLPRVGPSEE